MCDSECVSPTLRVYCDSVRDSVCVSPTLKVCDSVCVCVCVPDTVSVCDLCVTVRVCPQHCECVTHKLSHTLTCDSSSDSVSV